MTDIVSVYVTAGSEEEAKKVARGLLERRLVACANVFPVGSLYWWNGEIEEAEEAGMLLKTRRELVDEVAAAVKELHSYDVPCAVALEVGGGHGPYLDWVREETRAASRSRM